MTTIAIVGTGLIGTSLALALKSSNLRVDIVGTDYDSTARSVAQKTGAFKKVEARLSNAIRGADVVVFDAKTVTDRATFAKPHQHSTGIQHVFVAGRPVLAAGKMTVERPGQPLSLGDRPIAVK